MLTQFVAKPNRIDVPAENNVVCVLRQLIGSFEIGQDYFIRQRMGIQPCERLQKLRVSAKVTPRNQLHSLARQRYGSRAVHQKQYHDAPTGPASVCPPFRERSFQAEQKDHHRRSENVGCKLKREVEQEVEVSEHYCAR